MSDPRRKAVTIDGLQHDREYVFSLSALTREGPGQATSTSIRTKPDCELHNRHGCGRGHGVGAGGLNSLLLSSLTDSAHLVKILTPILLLLVCAALLWPQRKL